MASIVGTAYPDFGIPIGNYQKTNWGSVVKKVSAIAFSILGATGIGFLVGGLFGAILGAAITGGVALLSIAIDQISSRIWAHRHCSTLPAPALKDPEAPGVGVYTKTDVRVINNSSDSFEWKKELIRHAESSIELSPNFSGGKALQEVLELIEERMREKPDLKVHILLSDDFISSENQKTLDKLAQTPNFHYLISNRIFSTFPSVHCEENHVKLLVVDGKYFHMGGSGMVKKMAREEPPEEDDGGETYTEQMIAQAFRECDMVGEGVLAHTMRSQFFALFQKWERRMTGSGESRFFTLRHSPKGRCPRFYTGPGLVRQAEVKCIIAGPEHRNDNPITRKIARRFRVAKDNIRIGNHLFNPAKPIVEALRASKAKKTGYFMGTEKGTSKVNYLLAWPNRYHYGLVDTAYEYLNPHVMYHKKVFTTDDTYAMIGSYNLGHKSDQTDDELVCEIKDARVAAQVNVGLDIDAARSKHIENPGEEGYCTKLAGALSIFCLDSFIV